MSLCNNNDQTWISETLTSARSLGGRYNPRLSGSGFNSILWIQQMLMHRKTCLIPILKHETAFPMPSKSSEYDQDQPTAP